MTFATNLNYQIQELSLSTTTTSLFDLVYIHFFLILRFNPQYYRLQYVVRSLVGNPSCEPYLRYRPNRDKAESLRMAIMAVRSLKSLDYYKCFDQC